MSPISTSFAAVFARHARDRLESDRAQTLTATSEDAQESEDRDGNTGQPEDERPGSSEESESPD